MTALPLLLVLPLLALGAAAVVLLIQLLGRTPAGADPDGRMAAGLRRIRHRLTGCLVAAGAVLVVGLVLQQRAPDLLGLPLAVAPGLAAALALTGFAVWPDGARPASGGPVTASLVRRTATDFGPRRLFVVPGAVAALYLLALAVAAALASPDDLGRQRSFAQTQGDLASAAGPFPGSFYGVPLAVVTLVLVAATYAALRRVAALSPLVPAGSGRSEAVDRRWRETVTRVIVRLAVAALLGYAGGTFAFAGSAMRRASDFSLNGGQDTVWSTVGAGVVAVGVVSLPVAAVLAGAAAAGVLALRAPAVLTDPARPAARR